MHSPSLHIILSPPWDTGVLWWLQNAAPNSGENLHHHQGDQGWESHFFLRACAALLHHQNCQTLTSRGDKKRTLNHEREASTCSGQKGLRTPQALKVLSFLLLHGVPIARQTIFYSASVLSRCCQRDNKWHFSGSTFPMYQRVSTDV